jgi:hypothetical protein
MERAKAELQSILLIRWKQCYRILFRIDVVHLILLFGIMWFIGITGFYMLCHKPQNLYFLIIMELLIFNLHYQRRDKRFLRINIEYMNLVTCSEYVILTLPVVIILTIYKFWLSSIGMLVINILLGLIPIMKKKINKKRSIL